MRDEWIVGYSLREVRRGFFHIGRRRGFLNSLAGEGRELLRRRRTGILRASSSGDDERDSERSHQ